MTPVVAVCAHAFSETRAAARTSSRVRDKLFTITRPPGSDFLTLKPPRTRTTSVPLRRRPSLPIVLAVPGGEILKQVRCQSSRPAAHMQLSMFSLLYEHLALLHAHSFKSFD